ncbi:MAG: 3-methyl-2-oxobutanoate dehydrogenase subunit VorB [Anaerolineales bacterium]
MKELLKGNTAIAEAAIRAGCDSYFGYPITPQTELLEHMAKRMPELGRAFLQAESEVAAINMVYGAACTGARVMTSSSSPGVSLMAEGMSYIVGSEVPCVMVDIMRGGPGLGNIAPAQGDYWQMVKGGGHGDYQPIVLAPATVQEAIDLTALSFDLAQEYRWLVVVLADGSIGQMMEPAELPPMQPLKPVGSNGADWALTGRGDRKAANSISSLYLQPADEEAFNLRIQEKLATIREKEVRFVEDGADGADLIVIGFGTAGRVAQTAIRSAREAGLSVGLHRPISLMPFPTERISQLSERAKSILVVEMNAGQMVEDVRLAVEGRIPVHFHGRMGGVIPMPEEVLEKIEEVYPASKGDAQS